ncbi:hypothetical protein C0995_014093, partial [Termitomyces sp. Mi166
CFKLAGTEESGALIVNQATEVPATQGTLRSDESGNEDAVGDNDDSDDNDGAMNVDSAKQPEETQPVAPIKTVLEVKAPAQQNRRGLPSSNYTVLLNTFPIYRQVFKRPFNSNRTGLAWNNGETERMAIMR